MNTILEGDAMNRRRTDSSPEYVEFCWITHVAMYAVAAIVIILQVMK